MKTTKHALKLLLPPGAKTQALQLLLLIFAGIFYSGCTKKEFVSVLASSIISVSDTVFQVGDTIRINGSNFSTTAGQNLVSIASVALNVISATPTQLIAVIPASAQTGQLTVAYPGGSAAVYPGKIHIIVTGQPVIRSITPQSFAPGDTILLHGSGFGTPYTTNGLTIGGILVALYNVSDSVVKVIVPNNALSGAAIITTNGLSSLPYPVTVIQPNPLVDGRLYWSIATRLNINSTTPTNLTLMQGNDQDVSPYCSILSPLTTTEISQCLYGTRFPGYVYDNTAARYDVSNIVSDANGNAYYIYNSASVTSPASKTFTLVKLNLNPSYQHTVIWTQQFTATSVGSTSFMAPTYPVRATVNYPISRLSIDGNNLYIKLGLSNNFYVGDISQATFTPSLQNYKLPDANTYAIEFGKNYLFYGIIGTSTSVIAGYPTSISAIRYIKRGATGPSSIVPIDPSQTIVTYLTDPTHNDNLLIYTVAPFSGSFTGSIYKFNATTGVTTKLFDKSNWADATSGFTLVNGVTNYGLDQNLGFLWVNNHIYYANSRRLVNNNPTMAIYRLNDDGSSIKSTNIYANINITSTGNYTINSIVPLFIDKTQAKP